MGRKNMTWNDAKDLQGVHALEVGHNVRHKATKLESAVVLIKLFRKVQKIRQFFLKFTAKQQGDQYQWESHIGPKN